MRRAKARLMTRNPAPALRKYRSMRDFERTPEPSGAPRTSPNARRTRTDVAKRHAPGTRGESAEKSEPRRAEATLRFVVQEHRASHLHYDFRLEAGGVLMSWAVPKGPTQNPAERRLAMQTEDHPLDYYDFEGIIPEGNYGAGEVIVWDAGNYELVEGADPKREVHRGKLKFRLHGKKLRGVFALVKMHGRSPKDNAWLLVKDKDEKADPAWKIREFQASVISGRTIEDVAKNPRARRWISNRSEKTTKPEEATKTEAPTRARRAPLPVVRTPELATLVDAPFDGDEWLFEVKWDGIRAIVTVDGKGAIDVKSRNGNDLLARFPELSDLAKAFTELSVVVDGEIVALDDKGRSSFQLLQHAAQTRGQADVAAPIKFVAFDLLYARGKDWRREPLDARKQALESILCDSKDETRVIYSKHIVGSGKDLYALAMREGLEGIIAKKRDSRYLERRTRDWLKIKVRRNQECVIGGFTEPLGGRKGLGALLLGAWDGDNFVHVGDVGTGFTAEQLVALRAKLDRLEVDRSPFANTPPRPRGRVHWVTPTLVAQIAFGEWTNERRMRHPTFEGLRDDKSPRECVLERAVPLPPTRSSAAHSAPPKPGSKKPRRRASKSETVSGASPR